MDPNHDRQIASIVRRKNVEEQTILIITCILFTRLELRITKRALRTLRAVPVSLHNLTSVKCRRLRRLPTKIPDGGSGEADALPRVDVGGRVEGAAVLRVAKFYCERVVAILGVFELSQQVGEGSGGDARGQSVGGQSGQQGHAGEKGG